MFYRLILLFIFSPSAIAYPIAHYVGIGTGYTWTQADLNEQVIEVGNRTSTPSYGSINNRARPWQLYFGMRFHPYYGAELTYINYGQVQYNKTIVNETSESRVTTSSDTQVQLSGLSISHVFNYPVNQNIILQAKLGYLLGNQSISEEGTLITDNTQDAEPPQSARFYNSSSRSEGAAQFALSGLLRVSSQWLLRVQVNNVEFERSNNSEAFNQWFTSVSTEYEF